VVTIDALSGVAVAKSTGQTAVYHKIKDVIDTHTEVPCTLISVHHYMLLQVTVAKIHNVTVANGNQLKQFTNVMTSQPYHVMITFYHDNSHHGNGATFTPLFTSPNPACTNESGATPSRLYLQQVEFDCLLIIKSPTHPQISQSDVANAVSVFDSTTGTSYCHLVPASNKAAQRLISSINDITITLQIRAYDFMRSYEVWSEPIQIPFVPAFVLSSEEVWLGSCDASVKVEVWGTPQQLDNIQVSSIVASELACVECVQYNMSIIFIYTGAFPFFLARRRQINAPCTHTYIYILCKHLHILYPHMHTFALHAYLNYAHMNIFRYYCGSRCIVYRCHHLIIL